MNSFTVVPYTDHLRSTFADLWVPWLKSMTGKDPEPEDLLAVDNPAAFYIAKGGAVFFAIAADKPIAVVAVKNLTGGVYEFCKLVVLESARGTGAGRAMVQACIEFAREQDGKVLMLQSFRRLTVALDMYARMGFVPMTPPEQMHVLARTEVVMGMTLNMAPTV
jgi:GNAT superfamily N-acetyltransferase